MIPVFQNLFPLLKLAEFFPNIHVSFATREEFVRDVVAESDVTIFTGKESNARYVLGHTKKNSLFLFNGWGCNPIVVTPDANVDLAITKTVETKTFNSGQDCAGPDNILIHRDIADAFIEGLKTAVNNVKVGSYTDPEVTVGPIAEDGSLTRIASLLQQHRSDIAFGGGINFASTIVSPTIIVAPLSRTTNYKEFFSPVFFVNIYDSDEQLADYFQDPQYAANEMYVSLFGNSRYISSLKRSIVYREQTINDVERGNVAYGGYSHGASFVGIGSKIEARPILVPKEISQYLANTSITPIGAGKSKRIQKAVSSLLTTHFSNNLVFGFVFGSTALNRATNRSDIDTMVVVNKHNTEQTTAYLNAIRELTNEMGMTYDSVYPTEIITKSELDHMLLEAKTITFDAVGTSYSFWLEDVQVRIHALAGCKKGMTGDLALLREVEKATGKYPKLWKTAIVAELDELALRDPDAEILQSLDLESLRRLEGGKLMKFMHERIWCNLQGEKAESSTGDSSDEDGSSLSRDESLVDSVESMNGSCEFLNTNMNLKAIAC
jgi:aldehyde dehydrogenase (NAD+)